MPSVTQTFDVSIGNDPAENAIAQGKRIIYLDMLLSEFYGKMVRQGCSFSVTGIQASLAPDPDASGIDVGMSADVSLTYIPTTRHSRFAWNQVYRNWRNQKKLDTAVGSQVRYDDMEFGWDKNEYENRTSTIFGTGMGDSGGEEKLTLTGQSIATAGVNIGQFSLEDYYNSAYETPTASRDPFTNSPIKEPKWGATPYPQPQALSCTATNSAVGWYEGSNKFSGAIAIGDVQELPQPANVLCGLLYTEAFIMPDDTSSQDEDDFLLTITIFVKSWKSLIQRRKTRKTRGRRTSRSYRGRSKRTYRKYRKRR